MSRCISPNVGLFESESVLLISPVQDSEVEGDVKDFSRRGPWKAAASAANTDLGGRGSWFNIRQLHSLTAEPRRRQLPLFLCTTIFVETAGHKAGVLRRDFALGMKKQKQSGIFELLTLEMRRFLEAPLSWVQAPAWMDPRYWFFYLSTLQGTGCSSAVEYKLGVDKVVSLTVACQVKLGFQIAGFRKSSLCLGHWIAPASRNSLSLTQLSLILEEALFWERERGQAPLNATSFIIS